MHPRTLYASKCYWPGVSEAQVARATRRALLQDRSSRAARAECLGAIVFPLDDLVLGLFRAASAGDVRRASERAGMPCERVMEAVWLSSQLGEEASWREGNRNRDTGGGAVDALGADSQPNTGPRFQPSVAAERDHGQ
jgi:hypothetical protein